MIKPIISIKVLNAKAKKVIAHKKFNSRKAIHIIRKILSKLKFADGITHFNEILTRIRIFFFKICLNKGSATVFI